jgi:hypothetical protein
MDTKYHSSLTGKTRDTQYLKAVLRRLLGSTRVEVTRKWGKLHGGHNVCCFLSVVNLVEMGRVCGVQGGKKCL